MIRRPPRSPLFPYPPLSRSADAYGEPVDGAHQRLGEVPEDLEGAVPPLWDALDELRGRGHGVRLRVLQVGARSEEHTSELQSQSNLVCRLLLEKKKKTETSC